MTTLAFVYVDPSDENAKGIVTRALESGFHTLVFGAKDVPAELLRLGRIEAYALRDDSLMRDGKKVGTRIVIRSRADEQRARERAGIDEIVIVKAEDWKVIPIENLIAAFHGQRAKLIAEARTAEEARLFLDTLEVGVHGVLLAPTSIGEVPQFRAILDHRTVPPVRLETATVTSVRAAGVGDRVCVDTTSILRADEGLLVGSGANALFLVASEARDSPYVAARPFRVNAGAVHAYVLCPQNKTKYLSELSAGDDVLAVDSKGTARVVTVGRAKIERRPLLLVTATIEKRSVATLLQNAETIRLSTPDGTVSVVDLKSGDRVLLRVDDTGRHFGMPVNETMVER